MFIVSLIILFGSFNWIKEKAIAKPNGKLGTGMS